MDGEKEAALAALQAKFDQDPFCKFLGITLVELRPGYARLYMDVTPSLLNFHGLTHGGAIYALADAGFAAASNSHGRAAVALHVSMTYLAPTSTGTRLWVTASEEKLGKRTALYRLAVEDDRGELVALAQGVVYRRNDFLLEGLSEEI
ncbi:MAG: hotdog fold thioesterase [Clostridia bacterium]|nr:hotdog fold thioesterase [Clostridia bacterium]